MNKLITFINELTNSSDSCTMILKKLEEYTHFNHINYKFQYVNLRESTDDDFSIKYTKTAFEVVPYNPRNHIMISKIIFFDDETSFNGYDSISGLVYDAIHRTIVYIPESTAYSAHLFNKEFEKSLQNTPNNELYITDVFDGSICGLYYDKFYKQWCLCTRRGYDVSGLFLNNNKTFAECIRDQLKKYSPKPIIIENDHLVLPDLDCSEYYTLHFKDAICHPWKNENHIYSIKGSIFGIPSMSDVCNKNKIVINCGENITLIKNRIIENVKQQKDSLGNIIITHNAKYFIPTDMYEFIERCFYAYPKDKIFGHDDKHIYMTIRSYFNIIDRDRFIEEFPQYKSIVEYLKKIIDEVIIVLMNYYSEGDFLINAYNKEFIIIAKQIKENVKITTTGLDESIIRDIVCQVCNVNPFYTYLSVHRKEFD